MATSQSAIVKNVSLDEIVALADEMAALARIGVPLERGLADVAHDLTGRKSKLAAALSERMRAGQTLSQVLAGAPDLLPRAYRSVVEAGARSGRLSSAFEGLASSARRAAEMRRMTRAALAYPVFVALLAYVLFLISVTRFQPVVGGMYEAMRVRSNPLNTTLIEWGRTAWTWGPLVPVVLLVPLAVWWYRSRHAAYQESGILRSFPTQRLIAYGRIATFADTLALLVEHDAPLGESIVLAADAAGDSRLREEARQLAAELERGGDAAAPRGKRGVFPPFLRWLLAGRANRPHLADTLRQTADSYRRRAERLDERLRIFLPVVLSLVIGGTAVVLYALSVMVPWYTMLVELPKGI